MAPPSVDSSTIKHNVKTLWDVVRALDPKLLLSDGDMGVKSNTSEKWDYLRI